MCEDYDQIYVLKKNTIRYQTGVNMANQSTHFKLKKKYRPGISLTLQLFHHFPMTAFGGTDAFY